METNRMAGWLTHGGFANACNARLQAPFLQPGSTRPWLSILSASENGNPVRTACLFCRHQESTRIESSMPLRRSL